MCPGGEEAASEVMPCNEGVKCKCLNYLKKNTMQELHKFFFFKPVFILIFSYRQLIFWSIKINVLKIHFRLVLDVFDIRGGSNRSQDLK